MIYLLPYESYIDDFTKIPSWRRIDLKRGYAFNRIWYINRQYYNCRANKSFNSLEDAQNNADEYLSNFFVNIIYFIKECEVDRFKEKLKILL